MRGLLLAMLAVTCIGAPAFAVTINYDLIVDDVQGTSPNPTIGFLSSASIGAPGVGSARIDETEPDFAFALEDAFFSAVIGGGTAGTFFQKTFAQDALAGTVTISGFLGGLTGLFPGTSLVSADQFEFVYTNSGGGAGTIASSADLAAFLAGAEMSGSISGFFFPDADPDTGYLQTVVFSAVPTAIPVPATGLLLLAGVGGLALCRKNAAQASQCQSLDL